MTPLLIALGMVGTAWLVVGGACLGWGAWLLKRLAGPGADSPGPAALFWTGFSVLIGLLQVWHLFLPVDWRATVVLLGMGWGAACAHRAWSSLFAARPPAGGLVVWFLLALWLAFRALDFPRNYDSGLYHFSMVRWICEYPEVPGLANLHDRLGFNQSYFLFIALMNAHPFTNEGYHVANSLLWFALLTQLLAATWGLWSGQVAARPVPLVQCFLLPVIVGQALRGDISSPTPDLAVFAVGVAGFLFAARARENEPPAAVVAFLLMVVGCTLKLSFAAFGVAIAALLWFAVRPGEPGGNGKVPGRARWLPFVLLAGAAWGVPYAIRGIILSGYPAFPVLVLPWPVDWRLPAAEARDTAAAILAWGRAPGLDARDVLGSWAWFQPWLERMLADPAVTGALCLSGASLPVIIGATWRGRNQPGVMRSNSLLLVPLLVGLGVWFFTAPDPRFASWLLWLLATWLLAWAVSLGRDVLPSLPPRVPAAVSLAAAGCVLVLSSSSWLRPGAYGLHSHRRLQTQVFVTRSGLQVIIPADGADPRLGDAPLPASTHGKADLELRGATLREGFRTAPAGGR